MGIGKKIFLSFLAVIGLHVILYHLIFKDVILQQMKTDRHEQFLQEKEAAEYVSFTEMMRSSVFRNSTEFRELARQLPENLMYKLTIEDGLGREIYTKTSKAYDIEGKGKKKMIAEYYFQRQSPVKGRTVIQFYTDDYDILATKGVSMTILYIYGSFFLIGIVLLFMLVRWIMRPVNELSRVVQDIKSGKRDIDFSYKSDDEFGRLFGYFAEMVSELRRSEERQQEMIAAIAHDFRTPLTTIKGYASFIGTGRVTDLSRIKAQMKKIEQKSGNLEALLDELQDYAHLSSESPLKKQRVRVRTLIDQLISDYSERCKLAGIHFYHKFRIPAELCLEFDEPKIRRVFDNLLNNAIKYNKPDGTILLTCDLRENFVVFSVIDKGEGISAEDLPKVFTKFYRVEKSRNRDSGGTGLGLTICKNIVERHGGEIVATSKLGEGSCFSFTVPL